jgi:hydrogenase maturation factor HypE
VPVAIVNRDISYLQNQSKTNIKKYIDEKLPQEYEKCIVGLNAITKEAWNTAQHIIQKIKREDTSNKKRKLHIHTHK